MLQKILLVEDDPPTANLETRILERNGYSVVGAATGEEAVQATRQHADLDLILMDIDLGAGIKGTEAARIILSERDDVPLAFLSSHTDRETVELTEGITSYGYILKNSGPVVLLASIKMAFRLHEARQNEKAHKAKLEESELRYRQLFEQNPLPLWVYDLEDLRFLAVNEAACIKYGYSREEFLGMTIQDIRPPDDADPLERRVDHLRGVESEYSSSGIWRHCLRDGSIIYVEVIGHHIQFQGRRGRLILARDVTERLAAEEEVQRQLREKENLLQQSYQRSRNHFLAMEELLKLRSHDVQSDEGRKVIVETISRVAGLRILYDRLLIADNRENVSTSRYFGDLARAVLTAYSRYGGIRLETDIEDVSLSQQQLLGLGAVLNEVITHALQNAFVHRTEGCIRVELHQQEGDIIFAMSDTGEPWKLDQWQEASDSFGVSVVLLVTEQLGGVLGLEPDNGNRIHLRFPLAQPDQSFPDGVSGSPLFEQFRSVIEAVNQPES